jgi:hypothetical protein
MVKVEIKESNKEPISFYMDGGLKERLDSNVKDKAKSKDKDFVFIIDGTEGSGKTTFCNQIGKYLDPSLNLNRFCMNPNEFKHEISIAEKGQVVIYDEAYTGFSSRGALSEINSQLVSMMMEMRQKNLIVFIILPTFFLLDKYVALWRAKGLFHIYEKRGQRGFWVFYNQRKKKLLYLKGKKEYSYKGVKSSFRGRFLGTWLIGKDDTEYRKKKEIALKSRDRRTKSEKYIEQRNKLLYLVYHNFNVSFKELGDLCKKYNVYLKRSAIHEIVGKVEREGLKKDDENE